MTTRRLGLDTVLTVLIAAWLGAVTFFGAVVAPAAFAVLPSRALAGELVGRVLPALFGTGMVAGVLLGAGAVLDRRARRRGGRAVAAALMLASCGVAQFVIGVRIDRIRQEAGGRIDGLAATHPLRVTFGRLHGLSVAALGVAAASAAGALLLVGPRSSPGDQARVG